MTRIVGIFEDQFPSTAIAENPVALLQGFTAGLGQMLVMSEGGPVVYLGLGKQSGWCPGDGYRALQALSALSADPTTTDCTGIVEPLKAVTDERNARELVDIGVWLALPGPESVATTGRTIAMAIARAREWTNADSATMNPTDFADVARKVAADKGLSISTVHGNELKDAGFGAIHGMGSGSPYPPALIDIRYRPERPSARVTLVGKGVTFDTGGLSIKGSTAMASMRQDKCGASTVLAVMSALRDLAVDVEVRAVLPVIENMIGPHGLRPGDTVTSWNGKRIQVVDTDFEGRVILADALAYASADEPDLIVDIATLTYQVVTALGPEIGGLFARDDAAAERVMRAGYSAGEALWRLPYDERYLDQVVVPGGVKNHPETDTARATTAALFLGQFVPDTVPWVHLDITGPAWSGPASAAGATGFGVRTLLSLLRAT